jgi:hypothetical protein
MRYVEATLNHLLIGHFKDSRLDEICDKMSMGNNQHGRLAFINALKLLPHDAWKFVKALNDLRGRVVHRVRYLNLDLKAFLAEEENIDLRNTWKSVLSWWVPNPSNQTAEIALSQPKWYILTGVLKVMSLAIDPSEMSDPQAVIDELGKVSIYRREIKKPPATNPTQSAEDHQSEPRPE